MQGPRAGMGKARMLGRMKAGKVSHRGFSSEIRWVTGQNQADLQRSCSWAVGVEMGHYTRARLLSSSTSCRMHSHSRFPFLI